MCLNVFITLLVAILAGSGQGSYLPSVWSNTGLNSWNSVNTWPSAAWPVASVYGGLNSWNGLYGTTKANSWGLPLTYSAGVYGGVWGYPGHAQTVVPVSKQVAATPGSFDISPVPVGGERLLVH
ncbi:conserved hypothetical protein [Culex quinquefasciatus]|uniref:Uncharacterized protein n=1 Tax=Culex quinquefasciatus TaxID=7176 RepID=B0W901_CULQU|nr:conserved hypothetical protein [Culex quinquefasciatus]|eukprot:XP_001845115.1 conserved hypothetical protein [Culex quinquefasciatus]